MMASYYVAFADCYAAAKMTAPSLSGFDAAAARFDADERGNPVLAHMRARVFRELSTAFSPGAKLLEIGSGTGTEASRLVRERGARVVLVDTSARLLERATAKVLAVREAGLLGSHVLRASEVGTLRGTYPRGSFDGAFSSFGPLNCEPSLEPVAAGLAELVRPGGALVLSIINRWCPAEVGWFAIHGEWEDALRRWRGPVQAAAYPGGPKDVRTWYYSRREIEHAFSAQFDVERVEALPLLLPPPYLDFLVARFPRFFEAAGAAEPWVAHRRLLRDLGDHLLLRLRRR
jgi:SAM-dependent methyltransferase